MSTSKPRDIVVELQDRDIAILEDFLVCRIMTTAQAAALFFDGRAEAAKKRLQSLKAAGLLAERPRKASDPAVLYLTKAGIEVLDERGVLNRYPTFGVAALVKRAAVSPLTVAHELDVMDTRVAVHAALKREAQRSLVEFSTWPKLHEFESETARSMPLVVRPDGFVRVREKGAEGDFEHAFFVEVDRSSESLDTLVQKAAAYLNYFRSGAFALRCGGKRDHAAKYPFRVLFILKTEERRNNLAERLLLSNPPILTMAYLTASKDALANPLGKVWMRPADYRDAVAGSAFDVVAAPVRFAYQRRSAREEFVRERATLQPLLG